MLSVSRTLIGFSLLLVAVVSVRADDREMWLQRWGIREASEPIDYDPHTGQLLANQVEGAVLWDVRTGLALRNYRIVRGLPRTPLVLRFYRDDGVLVGAHDAIMLFRREDGELLRLFDLGGDRIQTLELSPDQTLLAAASNEGYLLIWEIETGQLLHRLDTGYPIESLTISHDNRRLVSGGKGGIGILWEISGGAMRHRFRAIDDIIKVRFSDDGKSLLTVCKGYGRQVPELTLWETETALPLITLPRDERPEADAGQLPELIEAEFQSEDVRKQQLEQLGSREGWEDDVKSHQVNVLSSPAGWQLYRNGLIDQAILMGPTQAEPALEWPQSASFYNPCQNIPLAFSADGRWLLTGGEYTSDRPLGAAVWDLSSGRLHLELKDADCGAFHPDGRRVIYGNARKLIMLDLESGDVLQDFKIEPQNEVFWSDFTSVQFTRDGKRMLTSSGDWYDGEGGWIVMWDLESGEPLKDYAQEDKAVMLAAFTRDETGIVAGMTPGDTGGSGVDELKVFDTVTGEVLHSRQDEKHHLWGLTPDPSGKFIVGMRYLQDEIDGYRGYGTVLFRTNDLSIAHQFRGEPGGFNRSGEVFVNYEQRDVLCFRDPDSGDLLHASSTKLRHDRQTLFHPGDLLLAAPVRTYQNRGVDWSHAVGFQNVLTGELEARAYLFMEPGGWLIENREGILNGSDTGLAHVTWRVPGTLRVEHDAERTRQRVDAGKIGQALTQSLAAGQSLREMLQALPEVEIPEPPVESPDRPSRFYDDWRERKHAAKVFADAGAEIQLSEHEHISFLKLEHIPLMQELLDEFQWIPSVERLYLADTGITDAQLDHVGLLGEVRRLSLWGNPITDEGVRQLSGIWNLEVLDVHDTQVTAEGLNTLRVLPNLKTLIVPDRIDPQDLGPLTDNHPGLEIRLQKDEDSN